MRRAAVASAETGPRRSESPRWDMRFVSSERAANNGAKDRVCSRRGMIHACCCEKACLLENTRQKVGTLPLAAVVAKKEKYISQLFMSRVVYRQ